MQTGGPDGCGSQRLLGPHPVAGASGWQVGGGPPLLLDDEPDDELDEEPVGASHCPATHRTPALHLMPQPPHATAFVSGSTHAPPHTISPSLQPPPLLDVDDVVPDDPDVLDEVLPLQVTELVVVDDSVAS